MNSTTPKVKLEGIEAARGLAATLVVIYHAALHISGNGLGLPWFGGAERFGHVGVDFFFVLSGFIIQFVHWADVGRREALPRYVERRFVRIFPLYWVVLAVQLALAVYGSQAAQVDSASLAANVALFPLVDAPIVGVAWTLQHELLFYLLFGLALVRRALAVAVFVTWGGVIVATMAGILPEPTTGAALVATSSYNLQFLMGMGAATVVRRGRVPEPRALVLVGGLAFFGLGIAESRSALDGYTDTARVLYGAAAFVLIVGLAASELRARIAVPDWLAVLGKASYSIYLGHLLAIGLTWRAFEATHLTAFAPAHLLLVLLILAGLVGGVALSMFVEYPLMAWARSSWRRVSTPTVRGAAR